MAEPLVSIVMPMLNARRFVRFAIQSVLHQASANLEVIVIDDGSRDGSAEEVRRIGDARVRMCAGPGRGVAAAFNVGVCEARGEFIARCDADDVYSPGRLRQQVEWLTAHADFGAICGGFAAITPRGNYLRDLECGLTAEDITEELRSACTRTSLCTWLMRADSVRLIGGCREYFTVAEDIDFQFRFAERFRVWFDPAEVYRYRLHDGSTTHRATRQRRLFFEEAARLFQNQRRQAGLDDLQRGAGAQPPDDSNAHVEDSRLHIQGILLGVAWDEHSAGRRVKALRTGLRACLTRPSNLEAWKSFGALAIRGK
jgi:glycosyltransferase involved in cell wall biosynthesis